MNGLNKKMTEHQEIKLFDLSFSNSRFPFITSSWKFRILSDSQTCCFDFFIRLSDRLSVRKLRKSAIGSEVMSLLKSIRCDWGSGENLVRFKIFFVICMSMLDGWKVVVKSCVNNANLTKLLRCFDRSERQSGASVRCVCDINTRKERMNRQCDVNSCSLMSLTLGVC